MAAPAAGRRLQRNSLFDLLGRDQGALLTLVSGLPAPFTPRLGLRRWAFDMRRVARRGQGGVGGVLVEALLKLVHPLLEGLQPLLILLDESQDSRLGGGRDLVPEVGRDRRLRLHAADLRTRPFQGKSSP